MRQGKYTIIVEKTSQHVLKVLFFYMFFISITRICFILERVDYFCMPSFFTYQTILYIIYTAAVD